MPACPQGHQSRASDWCDQCGLSIGDAQPRPTPAAPAAPKDDQPDDQPEELCPRDGIRRSGRFCEECGHDFVLGDGRSGSRPTVETHAAPAPASASGGRAGTVSVQAPGTRPAPTSGQARTSWTAEVIADRDYYTRVLAQARSDAASFRFPPYAPQRLIPLAGAQVRIGRRSVSKGTIPEIDLGEPPEDPGVSHMHVVLLACPDGRWIMVDPGSTNGTTVNGGDEPVPINVELPLNDGDRIHVGVWTTIILRRSQ